MKIHHHYKNLKGRELHKIHVSYQFVKGRNSGFGCIELTVRRDVTVSQMKEHIEELNYLESVVILSWQPARVIR